MFFRRYLSQRGDEFCQHAVKIIFECIDILPTMFKLFSMCNDPPPYQAAPPSLDPALFLETSALQSGISLIS
jgi:hypothetical protein